mgnify:CR=1 FL=1
MKRLILLLFWLGATALNAQEPAFCQTMLQKARAALQARDYNRAREYCESALPLCPQSADSIRSAMTRISKAIDDEKKRADRSARANRYAALALTKAKTDYTLGWHLACLAYQTAYDSIQHAGTEPGVSGITNDLFSDTDAWLYKTLEGHTDAVDGAVYSPDGAYILTWSADNTARLWDKSGMPVKTLEGHTSTVTGAIFSPDGQFILTWSYDKTARLWDKNGLPVKTLEGHTAAVYGAVYSPDGAYILTWSYDNTARLWEGFPLYIKHHWAPNAEVKRLQAQVEGVER